MVIMNHSDNPTSADNQQERLDMASWIVGFTDGEGTFSVNKIKNATTASGYQIFPEFVITQGAKSLKVLEQIQKYFECGHVYINRRHDNHKEPMYRFCVRSRKDINEKIIPFFQLYKLRTEKLKDFERFSRIISQMNTGEHLKKSFHI